MSELTINTDLAEEIITGFIRTELHRAGFSKTLLGVSGGIDSALSLYLSAQALGPENVLAVRMPYKTSSADTLEDAQTMIDALGVQSLTIEITDMVDPLINHYEDMSKLRAGNIMARMRMIVLYDQSVAFNGLVMGTSNKTEMLLGYSTVYGDSAAALQPIGDLYKTQVRQLAAYVGVPSFIIDKAPSPDLLPGIVDEYSLGIDYPTLDRILMSLEEGLDLPAIMEAARATRDQVDHVRELVRRSEHMRVLPLAPDLTPATS